MEEKLEKVELVRNRCNASYEEARAALEACDYDVLEAIVTLEREGKTAQAAQEAERAERAERRREASEKLADEARGFWAACRKALRTSIDSTFVAENRNGRVLSLPLIVVILGLFLWGATLWLLVIGLFCGLRYHIEGAGEFGSKASSMLDQAADFTDDVKNSIA